VLRVLIPSEDPHGDFSEEEFSASWAAGPARPRTAGISHRFPALRVPPLGRHTAGERATCTP
jgi:hypothetical protein